jgi:DNA-binding transcriptional ArsR family regulator
MVRGDVAPRSKAPADEHDEPLHRVAGLPAMRALAHPTRIRMLHLLRSEALSASELARRLGIRFGSARYHLRSLERAGIALRVGERTRRGGTEILFEIPRHLFVDVEVDAPRGMRQAMNRAYVAELLRRMDAAAAEPHPEHAERYVLSTREVELRPEDLGAASEALHVFLHRLDELALGRPTEESVPFTASVQFFRTPRSASHRPEGAGG